MLKELLAAGLTDLINLGEQDQAQILSAAATAGVSLQNVGEKVADSLITNASLPAPLSYFPRATVVQAVNNGINHLVAAGQSNEQVLFKMLIGWAQSEVKNV